MMTDREMRDQVRTALGIESDEFDVPKIVDALQARYGTVDIDDIPSDQFWEIVSEHRR
jgi:hypothetical protein